MIRTFKELFSIAEKHPKLVVYGAGWAGKIIAAYLKQKGLEIACFAVTQKKNGNPEEVDNIPVWEIDEVCEKMLHAGIILGAVSSTQQEMENYLVAKGVSNYYPVSEALLYEMRWDVFHHRAKTHTYVERENTKKYKIGYISPGYWDSSYLEERVAVNRVPDAEYIPLAKEILDFPCVGTEYEENMQNYKLIVDAAYCPQTKLPELDLIHTYNMVCFTDTSWIASAETWMPRMSVSTDTEKKLYKEMAEAIIKDSCKAILVQSKSAYGIHKETLERNLSPEMAEKVIKKTAILHPPQPILISEEDFDKKHSQNKIHFVFLGSTFFMKGGREVIRALEHFEDKYNFKLTLISALQPNDYFTHATWEEKAKWQKMIQEKEWIEHYPGLPNKEALEKCKEATVGLFPSFGDTYGYALLEMQACGCPVVSTNVRAFAETNNDECGWVCELPVNEHGVCNSNDLENLSNILIDKLINVFEDIFIHPNQIRKKGEAALERIRTMHDPKRYADVIRKFANKREETPGLM